MADFSWGFEDLVTDISSSPPPRLPDTIESPTTTCIREDVTTTVLPPGCWVLKSGLADLPREVDTVLEITVHHGHCPPSTLRPFYF
ncbi:MAG TPA: hypothetical protein VGO47_03940 [Chlamydiales bacterium]|nr:hypothetical protein [Chlamydiales bacterium]